MAQEVKGKMIGKKELRDRFPTLSEKLWQLVDHSFPVRVTRSFGDKILHPTDPIGLQVLPHDSELTDDNEGMDDPVGEKKQKIHPHQNGNSREKKI